MHVHQFDEASSAGFPQKLKKHNSTIFHDQQCKYEYTLHPASAVLAASSFLYHAGHECGNSNVFK